MDGVEALWDKLQLSEVEDDIVEISKEDIEVARQKGEFCLVGKIWVDRSIGKPVIESAMGKIWRLTSKATFRELGANVFIIFFKTLEEKNRVENGHPWLFDNGLFVIEPFAGLS